MRESNKTAIDHAIEDLINSTDLDLKYDLALDWINWLWLHTSAGYIRETPPHIEKQIRRPRPEPVLIPGEA